MTENDLNEQKINGLYNICRTFITNRDYFTARDRLIELIEMVEPAYMNKKYLSFNHILETYLYAYYMKDVSALNYTKYNINEYYRLYGFVLMNISRYDEAIVAYNKALIYNPVDIDTYFQLGELYKKTGSIKALKKVTFEFFNLCCSRSDMARFYRNLGFYYLENKRSDIAQALYLYSNIYYETEQATREIDFIESSGGRKLIGDSRIKTGEDLDLIRRILKENEIPEAPNPNTLGITFRVGMIERDRGNKATAFDCFSMVYDITLDEEAKRELENLNFERKS